MPPLPEVQFLRLFKCVHPRILIVAKGNFHTLMARHPALVIVFHGALIITFMVNAPGSLKGYSCRDGSIFLSKDSLTLPHDLATTNRSSSNCNHNSILLLIFRNNIRHTDVRTKGY